MDRSQRRETCAAAQRLAGRTFAVLLCLLSDVSAAAAVEETAPSDPEQERVTRVLRWISIYEPVYRVRLGIEIVR